MSYRTRLLGVGLLAGASVLAVRTTGRAEEPTTQPTATTRPAVSSSDPNWIGPNSWQRHLTIPPFVQTPDGMTIPVAASRPAAARAYITHAGPRSTGNSSSGSSTSSSSSRSRSHSESSSSRSSRSSSHSSGRSSSHSSRSSSSHSSRRSHN